MQLRSADAFVDMTTIRRWLFVAPRAHVAGLVAFLEGALQELPCVFAHKVSACLRAAPGLRSTGHSTPRRYTIRRLNSHAYEQDAARG